MTTGFFELAIIVLIAAVLGVLVKLLKQPVVLAYLGTGIIAGYFSFLNLSNRETFQVFADLGIMFLLFLVGLEINYSSLRLVGKHSIIIGLGQIVFTSAFGFFIAKFFNFNFLNSLYIAVALTFSSTIIVVKILSDKKDLHSLYGRISIGFLLVQDIVAILLLIFLAGIEAGNGISWLGLIFTILKGVILFATMLWLGRKILPFIFDKVARSQELLFLISLAWVFMIAVLVSKLGFSIEIAGFLAGLALANSSENFQIANRIRPLRDFFILIFFVILGSSVVFSNFNGIILPIIVFSLFVLIGNPLIVLVLMGLMGYRKRTSFSAGITVAQISEFSLILVALGLKIGHITEEVVALITAVGIITITFSVYLIVYADHIFKFISRPLSLFERKKSKEYIFPERNFDKSIIIIGCHRVGESIALGLPKENLLIIDFDPEVIGRVKGQGFAYIFGDIRDKEVFEKANLQNAELVISTSPDLEDNLILLSDIKFLIRKPKIIVRAETEKDADILYRKGADYVLLPHFTAGQYLGETIVLDPAMGILDQLKKRDLSLIRRIGYEI